MSSRRRRRGRRSPPSPPPSPRAPRSSFLLDGVTGSGKTEVYLAALAAARDEGKQGILLVPEIALAPALVRRLLARFGDRGLASPQRPFGRRAGRRVGARAARRRGRRRGTALRRLRAAAAARPRRRGRVPRRLLQAGGEPALRRPRRGRGRGRARRGRRSSSARRPLPSSRSRRHGKGASAVSSSPRARAPGRRPPSRSWTSGTRTAREGDHGRVLFARRTSEILEACFARGEQAIVLLNRRGFSPSLLCRACGEDFRCANCSVARTYHRRPERLLCHYCGDAIGARPAVRPAAPDVLMPVGFGTERLAERFEEAFPGVPYAVLDRDAAARRGGAAGVLLDFESRKGAGAPRNADGRQGTRLSERDGARRPRRRRAPLLSRLPGRGADLPARDAGRRAGGTRARSPASSSSRPPARITRRSAPRHARTTRPSRRRSSGSGGRSAIRPSRTCCWRSSRTPTGRRAESAARAAAAALAGAPVSGEAAAPRAGPRADRETQGTLALPSPSEGRPARGDPRSRGAPCGAAGAGVAGRGSAEPSLRRPAPASATV